MSPQVAVLLIFVFFALAETLSDRFFRKPDEVRADGFVEIISAFVLLAFTQPLIFFAADRLMTISFPDARDILIDSPFLFQLAMLLVLDDMMQYWWHRASHTFPFLYNLHRAHHNGGYMSVRIVYRNNVFYYLMMPSIWLSGIMIYLGLGWVYAGYLVVKMTVIIGAHAGWQWDRALYRYKSLSPLMWLLERTISTPATHSAHHGKHAADGITNYKGNFGNLLFFWDILFGTAKITRRYPEKYGVEGLEEANWPEQLFWPLIKAPDTAPSKSVITEDKPAISPKG